MIATSRATLTQLQEQTAAAPHSAVPWLSLGYAHLARLELPAAAEAFACAARREPGNPASRFAFAELLERQGHLACAVEALRAGLALAPREAPAAAHLGGLLARLGDDEGAAEAYGRAIAWAPINRAESDSLYGLLLKDGYYGLADLAVARRAPEAAETWLVTRAPRHAHQLMLRIALAAALGRAGRHAEAIAAWQRVMEQEPEHPLVFMGVAETWIRMGNLDAAARCYSEALAIDPANAALLLAQADLSYRRRDVARVRRQLRDPALRFVLSRHWRSDDPATPWDGTQPLDGQVLLVDACGDASACLLHGPLLLPRLAARGARVILQGTPDMAWLARLLPGVAQFVAPFDSCPPYAYRSRMRDLWLLLDWTWDDAAARLPLPGLGMSTAATASAAARTPPPALNDAAGAEPDDLTAVDLRRSSADVTVADAPDGAEHARVSDAASVHHLLQAIEASRREQTTPATRWIGIAWSSVFDDPHATQPHAATAACGCSSSSVVPSAAVAPPAAAHAPAHPFADTDTYAVASAVATASAAANENVDANASACRESHVAGGGDRGAAAAAMACDRCTQRSAPLATFEPLSRLAGVRLIALDITLTRPLTSGAAATASSAATTTATTIGITTAETTIAATTITTMTATTPAAAPAARIAEADCVRLPSWLAGPTGAAYGPHAVTLLRALDAIVSVDTEAAHLAGAFGRPCHLLLPHRPASHWQTDAPAFDGRRCAWYPSVRLHVQPRPGDWASLISDVAGELAIRS